MSGIMAAADGQKRRNKKVLSQARYLGEKITSEVLPLHLDIANHEALTEDQVHALEAVQIRSAG